MAQRLGFSGSGLGFRVQGYQAPDLVAFNKSPAPLPSSPLAPCRHAPPFLWQAICWLFKVSLDIPHPPYPPVSTLAPTPFVIPLHPSPQFRRLQPPLPTLARSAPSVSTPFCLPRPPKLTPSPDPCLHAPPPLGLLHAICKI